MKKLIFLMALLCLNFVAISQETSITERRNPLKGFSLELLGGFTPLPNNPDPIRIIGINLRYNPCFVINPPPKFCWFVEWGVYRRPPIIDPWPDFGPIFTNPSPDPIWDDFLISELEIGTTWMLVPKFGMDFKLNNRIQLGVFAGAGFQFTEARTTTLDAGTFKTTNTTAPLISYGLDTKLGLNDRLYAKLGYTGITSFESNMTIVGPDGSAAVFEGGILSAPMITVGLGFNLGR